MRYLLGAKVRPDPSATHGDNDRSRWDTIRALVEDGTYAIGKREITEIRKTYSEGAPGEVFGILGSMGFLEIAANRGAAAQVLAVGKGTEVNIILGEAAAAGKGA